MNNVMVCPFCGGTVRVIPCDDEGNYPKDSEYEANPYSGLGYVICHDENDSIGNCPIAREVGEGMQGRLIYDSPEEAVEMWNKSRNKN